MADLVGVSIAETRDWIAYYSMRADSSYRKGDANGHAYFLKRKRRFEEYLREALENYVIEEEPSLYDASDLHA